MLILGIDTGGTYTDGVILERDSGRILCTAKALTTQEDLAAGIKNCMRALRFTDWARIGMVGLSTTLATNAIVEGKGCRVGLVTVGRRPEGPLPAEACVEVQAGMHIRGGVREPLEPRMLDRALRQLAGRCDAVAVSGYASVRNPAHEQAVKKRAAELLSLPVVCGHEMTGALGYYERTVTTVLNARLIPLIGRFIADLRGVADGFGIRAPVMVVRGDGSLMRADYAAGRPVETVLSGPAASVLGARFLSQCENGVMVDMGGTTTDIACLRHGKCVVSAEGAVLAGWRTRVRALEIATFGLGGDSEIAVSPAGAVRIGPRRVIPLCRADGEKTGITPTDVLHATGDYVFWNAEKAVAGIQETAARLGKTAPQTAQLLYNAVADRLAGDCGRGMRMLGAEKADVLIGVGAPAGSWLKAAAARMGVRCEIPAYAAVANAVGAAVGRVCETSQALIRYHKVSRSYAVYTETARLRADDLERARRLAGQAACRIAERKARLAGAQSPAVCLEESLLEDREGEFMECRVSARAYGYPEAGGLAAARGTDDNAGEGNAR